LHKVFSPRLERRSLELDGRVPPVDLSHDDEVTRVHIGTLGSLQVREIASIQIRLQPMTGYLGHAFHAVERPAPALIRMQAEVVQPSVDGVRRSVEIASEFTARNQSDTFTEIPVLQFAPGLLAPADLDTCRRPGLPKCLEVP
jgi:hypothetical protein